MSRVRDIVALVKPRITLMVVATGVVGLYLAPQTPPPETKLGLLIGMSLLVGGANALRRVTVKISSPSEDLSM